MPVCRNIKSYTRRHSWLADFFSLLALALLVGTLYVGVVYYSPILHWILLDAMLYIPLTMGAIILDTFLIFFFLNLGAARFTDEDDACFHTFSGRRAGGGSVGMMFSSWLHHMEHVGKKHR